MTVAELEHRMSYRELLEWSEFYDWERKQRLQEEARIRAVEAVAQAPRPMRPGHGRS